MAYSRYSGLPKLFASNLEDNSNRLVFGSSYSSDDIDHNFNENYKIGWEVIGNDDFPSLQDFNAFFYTQSYLISYLYQSGVPEWSEDRTYNYGVIVNYRGELYIDKNSDNSKTNKNKNPEIENDYWEKFYSATLLPSGNIKIKHIRAFNAIKENFNVRPSQPESGSLAVRRIINYTNTINIGDCFDTSTGIFTCDKSGRYNFALALSYTDPYDNPDDSMDWVLLKNDVQTLITPDDPAQILNTDKVGNVTLSYNIELVAGDKVSFGYRRTHSTTGFEKLIFSGWLL